MPGRGRRWRAALAVMAVLVSLTAYLEMTSTVYGQWSWPGAATIVVGIATGPVVAARSSLVHHWGQQGAVASTALAIPLFIALTMVMPFTPVMDQEVVVLYPHAHAVWTFLVLAAIAVARLIRSWAERYGAGEARGGAAA